MATRYVPTIWASRYRRLSRQRRDQVNRETNQRFAKATGLTRRLDPRKDAALVKQWLEIRDKVMAGQARGEAAQSGGGSNPLDDIPVVGTLSRIGLDAGREFLDLAAAPWMKYARAEHNKGVVEKKGKGTNSDIMKYLRTCDHLWEKEKGRIWAERVGGEGVAWCAAFVNWCLDQSGIRGTRHAWALKFAKWGRPIPGPEFGAIVVQKTSSWRHVAFVDEVGGELKILGGNQKAATLRGPSNQISYQPLNRKISIAYVWPF